jgi:hypothetical protein
MFLGVPDILGVVGVAQRGTQRVSETAQQLALRGIETACGSRFAQAAVEAVLRGPLVDVLAADVARYRVLQRVVDPLVEGPAIEQVLAAVETAGVPQRVADQLRHDGVVDQAVARLLESEELWVLVEEIARSPSVTEAISHQSAGLADQMAEVVRDRSRSADARLEGAARRVLRRDVRAE